MDLQMTNKPRNMKIARNMRIGDNQETPPFPACVGEPRVRKAKGCLGQAAQLRQAVA